MAKVFTSDLTFEQVFKEYFNPLVNFVNSHINNWEDSREIVQNTFMKIWEVKDRLDIDSSLKAYLYQATRNGMIDFIRSSKRNRSMVDDLKNTTSEYEDEPQALNSMLIKQEILRAMDTLKPKNREIFRLNKIEGLTHKEIAAHLEISVRSVEDNVKRATESVREILTKSGAFIE
jgi:RNA polymerase sigma-70 factor (ECF subfamily)